MKVCIKELTRWLSWNCGVPISAGQDEFTYDLKIVEKRSMPLGKFSRPSVAHVVEDADHYRRGQAINSEQIPAVAFQPLAEPFESHQAGGECADHAD